MGRFQLELQCESDFEVHVSFEGAKITVGKDFRIM